jgi:hypothetical protein
MFDWFTNRFNRPKYPTWDDVPAWDADLKKVGEDMNKVIPFPEVKAVPPMPQVEPPKEKPATTFYRLGLTDNNRVSLQMGYSEVTFNAEGVDNLIAQLTVFRDQLQEDE